MEDQSKTGINKEWAQSELTKKSKQKIDIGRVPKDATIPQIPDEQPMLKFGEPTSELIAVVHHSSPNMIAILYKGEEVGEVWIDDNFTLRFKGNLEDTAASLMIHFKRLADNYLKMKLGEMRTDGNRE